MAWRCRTKKRVPLNVTNRGAGSTQLALEPWGDTYNIPAGATIEVLYLDAAEPSLTISVEPGHVDICVEGDGVLEIAANEDSRPPRRPAP